MLEYFIRKLFDFSNFEILVLEILILDFLFDWNLLIKLWLFFFEFEWFFGKFYFFFVYREVLLKLLSEKFVLSVLRDCKIGIIFFCMFIFY